MSKIGIKGTDAGGNCRSSHSIMKKEPSGYLNGKKFNGKIGFSNRN